MDVEIERGLRRLVEDSSAAVRVAVRYSGPGIDEADLDNMSQAFYTTKADGLGYR